MSEEIGTAGDDVLVANDTADTLSGLDGNDFLFGRGGADTLYGGPGNDDLYGGTEADLMYGGTGDDNYFVDDSNIYGNLGDLVWEAAGEGRDTVYTSANYSLYDLPNAGGEVERLGALNRDATTPLVLLGNNLDNEIWGNAGNNYLYGYGGHDILRGGPGDDTYRYPDGDEIVEFVGEGYDVVVARFSITLPDNVEEIRFEGDGGVLIGNALDNAIISTDIGSRLRLIIDGGQGADTMQGASGENIFFVDNPGDVILPPHFLDQPDTVFASVDFTLGIGQGRVVASIANDTSPLHFTGNELPNEITGNAGDNVLGGGAGADVLIGYEGADTFRFTSPLGSGNIDQFVTFQPGVDTIALGGNVFAGLETGALDPTAFTGPVASEANDRILYDAATGNIFFDADGSGPEIAQQFAIVHEGINLTAADFIVI